MGYRVKRFLLKNGSESFKLQFEDRTGKQRHARGIPKSDWGTLGLTPSMTIDEARKRVNELNQVDALARVEKHRNQIKARVELETVAQYKHLPQALVEEYETTRLHLQDISKRDKTPSYWLEVKRTLVAVNIPLEDWADRSSEFYKYWAKKGHSLAYVEKLRLQTNRWGRFIGKRTKQFFEKIPAPTSQLRATINEAWENKESRRGNKKSDPLTVMLLQSKAQKLSKEEYHWVGLSFWFGLRPQEVDLLHNPKKYKIDEHNGVPILRVYSPKIKEWKYIPCITPEQVNLLEVVHQGDFKRPAERRFTAIFGPRYSAYMGRKGFYQLMRALGQEPDHIQIWMGHKSFDTTFEHYVDKKTPTWTTTKKKKEAA